LKKKIIFWQNIPSIHQSALIRNLASLNYVQVSLVTAEDVPVRRREMGWHCPDFGKAELLVSPSQAEIDQLLHRDEKNTMHIFSGMRAYPFVKGAFRRACKTDACISFIAEIPRFQGIKGILRKIVYTLDAYRYRRRIECIFAIGRKAPDWFNSCGYPATKIYPFAYFVEAPKVLIPENVMRGPGGRCRISFIGSLVRGKGVDLLLKVLARLPEGISWQLTIIGDGPERVVLEQLRDKLGLSSFVTFSGSLPNAKAMVQLAGCDLLVLPSRYDGWGAVVSESLMLGVPVICSDDCGASVLVDGSKRGSTFVTNSQHHLLEVLYKWLSKGPLTDNLRESNKAWADMHISGIVAAKYFLGIIEHVYGDGEKPHTPWMAHDDKL